MIDPSGHDGSDVIGGALNRLNQGLSRLPSLEDLGKLGGGLYGLYVNQGGYLGGKRGRDGKCIDWAEVQDSMLDGYYAVRAAKIGFEATAVMASVTELGLGAVEVLGGASLVETAMDVTGLSNLDFTELSASFDRIGESLFGAGETEGDLGLAAAEGAEESETGILAGTERAISRNTKARIATSNLQFKDLSSGASRLVREFWDEEVGARVSIGNGMLAEDLRQASEFLATEIGVAQTDSRELRTVLGTYTRTYFASDETPIFHTHTSWFSIEEHFAKDKDNATDIIEAVMDLGGNVTHFDKTGLLSDPLMSPINDAGYVVGYP